VLGLRCCRRRWLRLTGEVLIMAGWLHDIGYSTAIGHTRFHPLDGAVYLSSWNTRAVCVPGRAPFRRSV